MARVEDHMAKRPAKSRSGTTQNTARSASGRSGQTAQAKKPNILVIMGDDIGWFNISAYNHGLMGYRTPNIDRLATEGALFTDCYGQQSCTAGRAAFILGQSPARTGLTKIGMPGAKEGINAKDPTLAELLKPLGYATAQFGKNHLGDLDEHLPTVHGFDEFFGNLYHLNAEEEPEQPSYPKDPEFRKRFGPRGVLQAKANGKGGQRIKDTGPLTRKRMETFDEEVLDATSPGSTAPTGRASPGSAGSTPPGCTFTLTSSPGHGTRPGWASMRTAWSSTMAT